MIPPSRAQGPGCQRPASRVPIPESEKQSPDSGRVCISGSSRIADLRLLSISGNRYVWGPATRDYILY